MIPYASTGSWASWSTPRTSKLDLDLMARRRQVPHREDGDDPGRTTVQGRLPPLLQGFAIYLGLCRTADFDRSHEAAGALINADLGMAVLVSIVHSVAMVAAGGYLAWLVYRYLDLKFVSRSWFNLDATWAFSLIFVGSLSLRSAWRASTEPTPGTSFVKSASGFVSTAAMHVRWQRWVIRYRSDPTRMSGFANSGHEGSER